jgi:hypothetical protein
MITPSLPKSNSDPKRANELWVKELLAEERAYKARHPEIKQAEKARVAVMKDPAFFKKQKRIKAKCTQTKLMQTLRAMVRDRKDKCKAAPRYGDW